MGSVLVKFKCTIFIFINVIVEIFSIYCMTTFYMYDNFILNFISVIPLILPFIDLILIVFALKDMNGFAKSGVSLILMVTLSIIQIFWAQSYCDAGGFAAVFFATFMFTIVPLFLSSIIFAILEMMKHIHTKAGRNQRTKKTGD